MFDQVIVHEQDIIDVPFVPRALRYEFSCAVSFRGDGQVIHGRCVNLSDSGALATFEKALDVWITGELTFHSGEYVCTIPVKVARADGRNAGLAFHPRHDKHKETIALLLRLAAETHTAAQPT